MVMANVDLTILRRGDGSLSASLRVERAGRQVNLVRDVTVTLNETALGACALQPELYGDMLAAMVFGDQQMRESWREVRGYGAGAGVIRLRLSLDEDHQLQSIMWELLRDPFDRSTFAHSERFLFSRFISSGQLADIQTPVAPELRAAIVVADPRGSQLPRIDVSGEVARARDGLGPVLDLVLDGRDALHRPTLSAIASALREGIRILYIVCHGVKRSDGQTYLWLEEDHAHNGVNRPVSGQKLVDTIRQLPIRPLLVILASCESAGSRSSGLGALGPSLVQGGVGAVLAMRGVVPQTLVENLLPIFWKELLRDGEVDRALAAARIALPKNSSWWLPTLWISVHDGLLFRPETETVTNIDLHVHTGDIGETGSVTGGNIIGADYRNIKVGIQTGEVHGSVVGLRVGSPNDPEQPETAVDTILTACPVCSNAGLLPGYRFCDQCGADLLAQLRPQSAASPLKLRLSESDSTAPQQKREIVFDAIVGERASEFVGRNWLFNRIAAWLNRPDMGRFFVITGAPGSGKTAISAHCISLAGFNSTTNSADNSSFPIPPGTISAAFFCSAQDDRWINPYVFAETLAIQLARRYPAFAEALLRQNSDLRIEITQQVDSVAPGATVTGVIIERLDLGGISADDAFVRLVREPLEEMLSNTPGQQVVLLVDALDEALRYFGRPSVVTLLHRLQHLPAAVRLIITTRPDPLVLDGFASDELTQLSLNDGQLAIYHRHDIGLYIRQAFVNDSVLKKKLTDDLTLAYLVTTLQEHSNGNFLYVRYILEMWRRDISVISSNTLSVLPQGLDGVYRTFLRYLFVENPGAWSTQYSPLFGTLAIARSPLREDQIAHFLDITLSQARARLFTIRQFLDADDAVSPSERTYSIYHRSFVDFLLDPDRSQSYWCEAETCNFKIVQAYQPGDNNWTNLKWSDADDYALQHLITHLVSVQSRANLRSVLFTLVNEDYLEAVTYRYKSIQLYVTAVDMAIDVAARRGAEELSQLVRLSLSRSVLSRDMGSTPPEALGVLARLGRGEEAREMAYLIADPLTRVRAYRLVAEGLLASGERAIAEQLGQQAAALARLLPSQELRVAELDALADLFPGWPCIELDSASLFNSLCIITSYLRPFGMDSFREPPPNVQAALHKAHSLLNSRLAEGLWQSDDLIRGSRLAHRKAPLLQLGYLLGVTANLRQIEPQGTIKKQIFVRSGPDEGNLFAAAQQIRWPERNLDVLISTAAKGLAALLRQGTPDQARHILDAMPASSLKVALLLTAAQVDLSSDAIWVQEATAIADSIGDPIEQAYALLALADDETNCGIAQCQAYVSRVLDLTTKKVSSQLIPRVTPESMTEGATRLCLRVEAIDVLSRLGLTDIAKLTAEEFVRDLGEMEDVWLDLFFRLHMVCALRLASASETANKVDSLMRRVRHLTSIISQSPPTGGILQEVPRDTLLWPSYVAHMLCNLGHPHEASQLLVFERGDVAWSTSCCYVAIALGLRGEILEAKRLLRLSSFEFRVAKSARQSKRLSLHRWDGVGLVQEQGHYLRAKAVTAIVTYLVEKTPKTIQFAIDPTIDGLLREVRSPLLLEQVEVMVIAVLLQVGRVAEAAARLDQLRGDELQITMRAMVAQWLIAQDDLAGAEVQVEQLLLQRKERAYDPIHDHLISTLSEALTVTGQLSKAGRLLAKRLKVRVPVANSSTLPPPDDNIYPIDAPIPRQPKQIVHGHGLDEDWQESVSSVERIFFFKNNYRARIYEMMAKRFWLTERLFQGQNQTSWQTALLVGLGQVTTLVVIDIAARLALAGGQMLYKRGTRLITNSVSSIQLPETIAVLKRAALPMTSQGARVFQHLQSVVSNITSLEEGEHATGALVELTFAMNAGENLDDALVRFGDGEHIKSTLIALVSLLQSQDLQANLSPLLRSVDQIDNIRLRVDTAAALARELGKAKHLDRLRTAVTETNDLTLQKLLQLELAIRLANGVTRREARELVKRSLEHQAELPTDLARLHVLLRAVEAHARFKERDDIDAIVLQVNQLLLNVEDRSFSWRSRATMGKALIGVGNLDEGISCFAAALRIASSGERVEVLEAIQELCQALGLARQGLLLSPIADIVVEELN
jgi:hypothetical protein